MMRWIFPLLLCASMAVNAAETMDAAKPDVQASLDKWCESARATERQELQRRIIEVCKTKGRSDTQCNQEAAAYASMNVRSVDPSADIPVCVQAREYRKAHGGAP